MKLSPVLAVPLLLSFLIAACAPDRQSVARTATAGGSSYMSSASPTLGIGRRVPSNDSGENEPDSYAPQRSKARSGPIYSTDYSVDRTLGGNTRVSDQFGNSSTFDKTLGGSLRSTSNTGRVNTYSQPLGGGYKATTSGGTIYQAEQNLGGGYRMTGSNGTNYQRTQMLGGGYRYDPN